MTWIKLEDKAPRHPKIASLTDKAFRWWVLGLCYASEFLTDGVLPSNFWKTVPKPCRAELTAAKLWDWIDPNFQIHDYLTHQTSRESVEKERRRNQERRTTDRGTTERRTAGTTGDVPPAIENREQNKKSEIRKEKDLNTHSARVNGHGNGANAPNALPRDHRFHAVCGPRMRVCFTDATAAKLAEKWGGSPDEAMPRLRDFSDWLEQRIGEGAKGDFLWLIQHFEAFMESNGRVPVAPPAKAKPAKDAGVSQAIDAWGRE